jgi:putative acetyltransferase
MITIRRTTSTDPDFIDLVKSLDAELSIIDGSDHSFYAQFNTIRNIHHVVIACEENEAAGCGAIKEYTPEIMEIKRMFVLPYHRRKGIAVKVLAELEQWASELSYEKCILETGRRQPDAIALYTRCGYKPIPNFGQYAGIDNSVCFEKEL